MMSFNDVFFDAALKRFESREAETDMLMKNCDICGNVADPEDIEEIGDKLVCDLCSSAYYKSQYPQMGANFLQRNKDTYLKNDSMIKESPDLFLNWWFFALNKKERVRILQNAFEHEKMKKLSGYDPDMERDFCIYDPEWNDYVSEQLSHTVLKVG